jgi:hypothetical protein
MHNPQDSKTLGKIDAQGRLEYDTQNGGILDPVIRDLIEQWLVALLPITTILEVILSSTWNRVYFKNGLTLFNRSFPTVPAAHVLNAEQFEAEFEGKRGTRLLFRQIEPSIFGFRHSFFHHGFSIPVMHGIIKWNHDSTLITVKGYANWFPLTFLSLVVFIWSGLEHAVALVAFALTMYTIFYLLQARRFTKVGRFASEIWKKTHPELTKINV